MSMIRYLLRRLPIPRKKLKPDKARALLHIGMILLMLGLIGFSVYQVARHMTVGLNTLRTQEITDESYVRLELYLFRDEEILYAEGSDTYLYRVQNGDKVGVGDALGTAYAVGDAAASRELQERLNTYVDRIALLREIGGLGTPADARAEADAVDERYLALLEASHRGDLAAVGSLAEGMLEGLGRYGILTGTAGTQSVAALQAEQRALMAEASAVTELSARTGGYFYYDCDGYETLFDYASAMTMTPADFRTLTEQAALGVPSGVAGKLVKSATWYAAAYIPLSDSALEVFQQGIRNGTTYTMRCGGRGGAEVDMTVVRLVPDEGGALVVFRSQDMPEDFVFLRSFYAETVAYRTSGYRIPTEAVVTLHSEITGEDVTGVYVLAGNVVEFRKISILVRRDGYIIAETYADVHAYLDSLSDEDYAKRTADGWSYLRLNDNIITSGNELYEGKMIG